MSGGDEVEAGRRPARPPARRASTKSARRRSRELALQGLYEWLLGGADAGVVDAHVREQEGFDKCDAPHFDLLLHGPSLRFRTLNRPAPPMDQWTDQGVYGRDRTPVART